jgi:hypothetical protein
MFWLQLYPSYRRLESALGTVQKRELLPEFHQLTEIERESEVSLKQTR